METVKRRMMIKFLHIVTVSTLTVLTSFGQSQKWAGTYGYGTHPDSGRTGYLKLYPNSDSTLIFSLDLNRGAPSYNSGELVGELILQSDTSGSFSKNSLDDFIQCQLTFIRDDKSIWIHNTMENDECGYGHGVFSYGQYLLKDSSIPLSFTTGEGKEIEFENYDWHLWWDW